MLNSIYINNFFQLLKRFTFLLILYQICRFIFYFKNIHYFSDIYIGDYLKIAIGGIRFDISAILYTNCIIIVLTLIPSKLIVNYIYKKVISYLFILINMLVLTISMIDVLYYPFSKRRLTLSSLDEFYSSIIYNDSHGIFQMLLEFLKDYWYLIPTLIIFNLILKYTAKKTELLISKIQYSYQNFISSIIFSLFILTLVVFGFRGTVIIKDRPITISNAGKYTKQPNEISLVINTPFSIIRTYDEEDLEPKNYFSKQELNQQISFFKKFKNKKMTKKNVVVIVLESMSTEYYGFYNKYKADYPGFTPFLDSLINHSFTSYNSFSNGTKSIDAIPSILASIPTTKHHFSLSKYCTNKIDGIGSILKKEGYQTSFFHGAPNGSMGFESISNLLGIDEYYGMDNYDNNEDFDGVWGIWDEEFFKYFADELNNMQEPFFSSIFSCTSHHPFKIPKNYKNKFKKGNHPMHECVQYTDYSLKLFFNKIKKMNWFKNTLFVITADHTNISFQKEYKTISGIYRVPIIFYDPSSTSLNRKTEKIIQHIDIMPSILSYLNYNKEFISLGNNVFNNQSGYSINYNNGYQLIIDNKILQYNEDEEKITKIFDLKNNALLNIHSSDKNKEITNYANKIKAFIQTYNNNMINNTFKLEN